LNEKWTKNADYESRKWMIHENLCEAHQFKCQGKSNPGMKNQRGTIRQQGNTKRAVLVLTLGLGQSGQPEAKMPKKKSTLSQNAQQYFNPMSKNLRIF
jgi:hypothetical protein